MSHESAQDSLQHYFDDMFLEPSTETATSTSSPQPQPRPQRPPEQPELSYQEQLREKEALAKQKLERLLQTSSTQDLDVKVAVDVEAEVDIEAVQVQSEETVLAEAPVQVVAPVEAVVPVAAEAELAQDAVVVEESGESVLLDSLAWLDNGRPRWAQERFDVLLFSVSGLTLAVPLIALGQIQPLTDELTPLFGQADWFMGLQPTPMGKIRTVNTAKFVMPERYDEAFLKSARYVISIDGLPWGLAVDAVNQPITLEPEDVKWRGERAKRAWLAGTVKQHMCALIDIPRMGKLLEDQDRSKKI